MDKMKLESADITSQNIEKIAELFPNCITETKDKNGNLKKAINFELLKQDLSKDIVDGKECYEFTWVGKKDSIIEANKPIRKTLRPCKEDSVNWDSTENLYIEGDNLEVLKLLQESYLGKVKMIYIDPPYNTGNDFIYPDDYKMTDSEFNRSSDYFDEEGNIKFSRTNSESEGKFHSDWCSMIYSRLMLARNLLSEDGVIFISIDDNEVENLKKICNEIYSDSNYVAQLCWEKKKKGSFLSNSITNIKEYILVYCKNIETFNGLIGEIKNEEETYPCVNASNKREIRILPSGINCKYKEANYFLPKGTVISDTTMNMVLLSDLVIKDHTLHKDLKIEGNWRYSQESMNDFATKNEIYITRDLYIRRIVRETRYKTLKDILPRTTQSEESEFVDFNKLLQSGWGSNEDADEELRILFEKQKIMDYPKPTKLLTKLISSYRNMNESIVLDFFSGSATTAHAVMKLNSIDKQNRKFIMVQLPEPCDEKSEAFKAGYKNICEIGKERIRRSAKKIAEDNPNAKFDGGFRVFKVDDSNMKDVYYAPAEYSQTLLDKLESNIKEDRTDLDLFFGCILDWGLPLNLSYTSESIENCSVHTYSDNALIACFNDNIPESVIKEIAKKKPLRVVFRDSSFADTPSKINVTEIFKLLSPDTRVKVI